MSTYKIGVDKSSGLGHTVVTVLDTQTGVVAMRLDYPVITDHELFQKLRQLSESFRTEEITRVAE